MTWQTATFNHSSNITDTTLNDSVVYALNNATVPANIAESGVLQSSATTDAARRTELADYAETLQQLTIDPWGRGDSAQSKQSAISWLSPTQAATLLTEALEAAAWEASIVLMISGATPAAFALAVKNANDVFPVQALTKIYRHAQTLTDHDSTKFFDQAEPVDIGNYTTAEQQTAFEGLGLARQNVAIAEALASDTNPTTLLSNFITRRSARLSALKTDLGNLSGGDFSSALYIEGEYLSTQFSETTPPNINAAFCCVIAFGGTSDAIAPLKEALSL